jgi:hypothetical protein
MAAFHRTLKTHPHTKYTVEPRNPNPSLKLQQNSSNQ